MKFLPVAASFLVSLAVLAIPLVSSRSAEDMFSEGFWMSRIEESGVDAAKDLFADMTARLNELDSHTVSHAFGAALYAAGETLPTCPLRLDSDEFLSSGCYHEYISRAISEKGVEVLAGIRDSCKGGSPREIYLCDHGIGHGVLAYFGYEKGGLGKALSTCDAIHASNNCYRAALMERDFRRLADDLDGARVPDDGDMYGSCEGLKETTLSTCVYWQPNWWLQVSRHEGLVSGEDIMPKLRDLCGGWQSEMHRHLCVVGTGFTTLYLPRESVERSRQLCDMFYDDTNSVYCRIGVAARYRSVGRPLSEAILACDGLADRRLEMCMYAAEGHPERIEEFPKFVIW